VFVHLEVSDPGQVGSPVVQIDKLTQPCLPEFGRLSCRYAALEHRLGRRQFTDYESRAGCGGTELLPLLLVGYHARYDDLDLWNGSVVRPNHLQILEREGAPRLREDLAEVVQVDHRVRLVGQSQDLGNGSGQRCLSRAWRSVEDQHLDARYSLNVAMDISELEPISPVLPTRAMVAIGRSHGRPVVEPRAACVEIDSGMEV
jgi:hypothetical protein